MCLCRLPIKSKEYIQLLFIWHIIYKYPPQYLERVSDISEDLYFCARAPYLLDTLRNISFICIICLLSVLSPKWERKCFFPQIDRKKLLRLQGVHFYLEELLWEFLLFQVPQQLQSCLSKNVFQRFVRSRHRAIVLVFLNFAGTRHVFLDNDEASGVETDPGI